MLKPTEVIYLNPDERADDISDAFTVFGRDHYQIKVADFCVVDARQRRGIGVGIEMLSAKRFMRPLIIVAPPDSHYRRKRLAYLGGEVDDYIHAHMSGLADVVVDDFEAAGKWIKVFLKSPTPIKGIEIVDAAIDAYKKRQLAQDIPMKKALAQIKKGP